MSSVTRCRLQRQPWPRRAGTQPLILLSPFNAQMPVVRSVGTLYILIDLDVFPCVRAQ